MKIEKNKIVFSTVIVVIIAFLVSYYLLVLGGKNEDDVLLKHTTLPQLEEDQKTYDSKLDAINDLKEVHQTNAPSIYDEKLIDSLGYYDPALPDKQKERIIDSIYNLGASRYAILNDSLEKEEKSSALYSKEGNSVELTLPDKIEPNELGLEHQLFFAAAPNNHDLAIPSWGTTDPEISVVVDGTQVVKTNSRIRLRLAQDAIIERRKVPKNTPIFGFISFQPNRVLIVIKHIEYHPTRLKAFDLQDGSEGIYVENNFRAEATTEVVDELIGDVNIPGIPQFAGVSKILARHNRSVKVTVLNNYRLILKPGF